MLGENDRTPYNTNITLFYMTNFSLVPAGVWSFSSQLLCVIIISVVQTFTSSIPLFDRHNTSYYKQGVVQ